MYTCILMIEKQLLYEDFHKADKCLEGICRNLYLARLIRKVNLIIYNFTNKLIHRKHSLEFSIWKMLHKYYWLLLLITQPNVNELNITFCFVFLYTGIQLVLCSELDQIMHSLTVSWRFSQLTIEQFGG